MTRDCAGCPLGDAMERRDFLRSLLAMGAVFVSGVGPRAEKSYPIPVADGVAIDKEESVIIARHAGRAYAFSLACPHAVPMARPSQPNCGSGPRPATRLVLTITFTMLTTTRAHRPVTVSPAPRRQAVPTCSSITNGIAGVMIRM